MGNQQSVQREQRPMNDDDSLDYGFPYDEINESHMEKMDISDMSVRDNYNQKTMLDRKAIYGSANGSNTKRPDTTTKPKDYALWSTQSSSNMYSTPKDIARKCENPKELVATDDGENQEINVESTAHFDDNREQNSSNDCQQLIEEGTDTYHKLEDFDDDILAYQTVEEASELLIDNEGHYGEYRSVCTKESSSITVKRNGILSDYENYNVLDLVHDKQPDWVQLEGQQQSPHVKVHSLDVALVWEPRGSLGCRKLYPKITYSLDLEYLDLDGETRRLENCIDNAFSNKSDASKMQAVYMNVEQLQKENNLPGFNFHTSKPFEHSSQVLDRAIMHDACCRIKQTYSHVKHAWPAIDLKSKKSVIYAISDTESKIDIEDIGVDCKVVLISEIGEPKEKEVPSLMEEQFKFLKFTDRIPKKISKFIDSKGPELMAKHSNISMISGCPFRITNGIHQQEWCLVIYCCGKGFKPISEKMFPTKLGKNKIPVDVRNGYFLRKGGHKRNCDLELSHSNRESLSIGSEIFSTPTNLSGTLGGFVSYTREGRERTGIVTCAHVAIPSVGLGDCRNYLNTHPITFHVSKDKRRFGTVVDAHFTHSDRDSVSTDAALIEVDENFIPEYGQFTKAHDLKCLNEIGFSELNPPCFCDGLQICKAEKIGPSTCFKYGSSTNLSVGTLSFNNALVRFDELSLPGTGELKIMYHQYHVMPKKDLFFASGDSGAMVFILHYEHNVVVPIPLAIGLAIGHVGSSCVVTGIEPILESFHRKTSLKKFAECRFGTTDSGIGCENTLVSDDLISRMNMLSLQKNASGPSSDYKDTSSDNQMPRKIAKPAKHKLSNLKTENFEEIPFLETNSGLEVKGQNLKVKWKSGNEGFVSTINSRMGSNNSTLKITTPEKVRFTFDSNIETNLRVGNEEIFIVSK